MLGLKRRDSLYYSISPSVLSPQPSAPKVPAYPGANQRPNRGQPAGNAPIALAHVLWAGFGRGMRKASSALPPMGKTRGLSDLHRVPPRSAARHHLTSKSSYYSREALYDSFPKVLFSASSRHLSLPDRKRLSVSNRSL